MKLLICFVLGIAALVVCFLVSVPWIYIFILGEKHPKLSAAAGIGYTLLLLTAAFYAQGS